MTNPAFPLGKGSQLGLPASEPVKGVSTLASLQKSTADFDGVIKAISDNAALFKAIGSIGQKHATALTAFTSQSHIAALTGYGSDGDLAARLSGVAAGINIPLIDFAKLLPSYQAMMPTISAIDALKLATPAIDVLRFNTLTGGFMRSTKTLADSFGTLSLAIGARPDLRSALDLAIEATQAAEPDINYELITGRIRAASVIFNEDKELADEIAEPLQEAKRLTGVEDDVVYDLDRLIGWAKKVRPKPISLESLFVVLTAGIGAFVMASPSEAPPTSLLTGMTVGGGIYLYLSTRENGSE